MYFQKSLSISMRLSLPIKCNNVTYINIINAYYIPCSNLFFPYPILLVIILAFLVYNRFFSVFLHVIWSRERMLVSTSIQQCASNQLFSESVHWSIPKILGQKFIKAKNWLKKFSGKYFSVLLCPKIDKMDQHGPKVGFVSVFRKFYCYYSCYNLRWKS